MRRLTEEAETWHWKPWLRTKTEIVGNIIQEVERTTKDSVENFPDDIFTGEWCTLTVMRVKVGQLNIKSISINQIRYV